MYNDILDFLISLTPTKFETIIGGGVALVGVLMQHLFGEWNNQIEALLILMVIDYLTGLSAAYIMPNTYLDSRKGLKGIVKKFVIWGLIVLAHWFDIILGQDTFRRVAILFFIGNEGLSILENAANCGLPIPKKLKDALAQFTKIKQNK